MELVGFCKIEEYEKNEVITLFNSDVQPRLLECDDIAKETQSNIKDEIRKLADSGFETQSEGNIIRVPHILRLNQRSEQFLYCAKSTLRELAKIFGIFFSKEFKKARYDRVAVWAKGEFGEDSDLAQVLQQDHDRWIKHLVAMRNAVEHPEDHSGY